MVSAPIYTHINSGGHMTVNTLGAGAVLCFMKVMAGLVIGLRGVAAGTEVIALGHKL